MKSLFMVLVLASSFTFADDAKQELKNSHDNLGNNHNGSQPQADRILCESINSKKAVCSIPLGSKVKLYRQLSRSSCNESWGYNRREIWVINGCRAEFDIL